MAQALRGTVAAGITGAVVAAVAMVGVPAQAASPGYLCDRTHVGNKGKGFGLAHCVALGGAPEHGEIRGDFVISPRKAGDQKFNCRDRSPDRYPSGNADLPRRVFGFFCTHA